jgi:hypothetical protein
MHTSAHIQAKVLSRRDACGVLNTPKQLHCPCEAWRWRVQRRLSRRRQDYESGHGSEGHQEMQHATRWDRCSSRRDGCHEASHG